MLKKVMLVIVAMVVVILTSCGGEGGGSVNEESKNQTQSQNDAPYKIGFTQFVEHPALDQCREGFKDRLNELGLNVEIEEKNSQGDALMTNTIGSQFVDAKKDLIFAVSTLSAQGAKANTSEIPIIFSAVTDAVEGKLVESNEKPNGNLSGTSDRVPIEKQLELLKKIDPNIKKIGIIYNTSEINSSVQLDLATEIGKGMGLEVKGIGITVINDLPQASDSILQKADAIYVITDNLVASGVNIVAEKAIEKGKIVFGAERAHVEGGALITDGISYYKLGQQSADMARRVLVDGEDIGTIPVETLDETELVINMDTLNRLGITLPEEILNSADEKIGE